MFAVSAAQAQGISYANAFANFHNLDAGTGDLDLNTYGGEIEFIAQGFTFAGQLTLYDIEGVELTTATLGVSYRFGNGFSVEADYD